MAQDWSNALHELKPELRHSKQTHKVVYSSFVMLCKQDHGRNKAGYNAPGLGHRQHQST